jgi:hypothetical protein
MTMKDNESFNRLIDERGFFTKEGKTHVDECIGKAIDDLLRIASTPNQTRLIAAALKSMIGNKVADIVSAN